MTPSSQDAGNTPRIIGQYHVVRVLGYGGMGTVYQGARTGDFTQTVAIKVLRADHAEGAKEDRILTSLDHPSIVRLLDRGRMPGGTSYLVMEYVDGKPIDAYCEEHVLDVRARVELLLQAAEAVAYAHSKLVLHADLKPHNMLVTTQGEMKLLDFGLARWLQETDSGQPYFSPGFSPPEQQFGQNLTVASDVFSFGRTAATVIGEGARNLPDLKAILQKASAAAPTDRYRSMREFSEDLKAWHERRPVEAYRSGRAYQLQLWIRRNRLQATLSAVLMVVIVGSAVGVAVETGQASRRRHVAQARLREVAAMTGKLQSELYTSLPSGELATPARRELLVVAAMTLEKMQRDDNQDPVLRQEIASQYRHLAQLQVENGDAQGAALSVLAAERLTKRTR